MKKLILLSLLILASCETKIKVNIAEAEIACGQCLFELESDAGCGLAVKVLDKAYFVDGFGINDFGDAHDEDKGFCNVVRKAKVAGVLKEGRFKASSIDMLD